MNSPLSGQRLAFPAWALLGVLPAVAACDGYMELEGYAYEWLNPPPGIGSDVVGDAQPPLGREVIPLDGVEVRMRAGRDFEGMNRNEILATELWEYDQAVSTEANGSFSVGFTVPPHPFYRAVQAKREGFEPAAASFPHDTFTHRVLIYMVRDKGLVPDQ
jgi:hypothetical protein